MAAVPPATPIPPPPRPPSAARPRVRWGFGDAVWVLVAGIGGSAIVGAIVVAVRHSNLPEGQKIHFDAVDTVIATGVQYALMLGLMYLLITWKGNDLRHDLGLVVHAADWWWVSLGVGVSIVVSLSLFPISRLWDNGNHGSQEIGKQLQDSSSWSRIVLCLLVILVAPVAEELLFRGIVLRSALRRMPAAPAVIVSGASFAALHLLDVTTFPALPALFALGVFSAAVAVRSGDLSRSILLHSGFNLVGAIQLLAVVHR